MSEPLRTVAEATDYARTSLHAEVIAFIEALAPLTDRMDVQSMGRSAQDREMPVLVLSAAQAFTPEEAHAAAAADGRPVVMVLCNIHAGEVEGKEAALMLARDVTTGPLGRLMEGATVVLVPLFNPDGNDLLDAANRAMDLDALHGQRGPDEVGTRYTGEGINLNRDYTKQEAIESRHLAALFGRWNPHVFVDSHTSNGSIHAYALTYDTAHTIASGPEAPIAYTRDVLLPEVGRRLEARTGLRTFFYGNFRNHDDPTQGWESYAPLPRYGSHYRGLTGRLDVLLEAYSYLPFEDRVRVTYEFLVELLDYAAERGREIVDLCQSAAEDTVARGAQPALEDSIGIDYGVPTRTATGDLRFRYPAHPLFETEIAAYDAASMQARRCPGDELTFWPATFHCRYIPERSVRRPRAYVVPARLDRVIAALRSHNLELREPGEEYGGVQTVEQYTIVARESAVSPDVGDRERSETVFYVSREVTEFIVRPDSVIVPMAQPLANLAAYLLEPHSDDGFARWGYFAELERGDAFPVRRIPGAEFLRG